MYNLVIERRYKMKVIIHEWGLDDIIPLNINEFVTNRLEELMPKNTKEVDLNKYMPQIIEEYNQLQKQKPQSNELDYANEYQCLEYAEGLSNQSMKKKLYRLCMLEAPNTLAVDILYYDMNYSGLELITKIKTLILTTLSEYEDELTQYEDLYHSPYRWLVRGIFAAIKVCAKNNAQNEAMNYIALLNDYNPHDNFATYLYLMESFVGFMPYEQFNENFPLNDDHGTRLMHSIALLANNEIAKADALLAKFNDLELDFIFGKQQYAKRDFLILKQYGYERNSYEELAIILDNHSSLRQYLINSQLNPFI